MNTSTARSRGVAQNEGWLDRSIRVLAGLSLLLIPAYTLEFDFSREMSWEYYAMLFSVVPLITGAIGWCPIYHLFGIKSCGTSAQNPCGSFPYQIDAALGHNPIPDNDVEHTLEHSRHAPTLKQIHNL